MLRDIDSTYCLNLYPHFFKVAIILLNGNNAKRHILRIPAIILIFSFGWNISISQNINEGQLFSGPSSTENSFEIDLTTTLNPTFALVDDMVLKTIPERFSSFENLALYLTNQFNDEKSQARSIYTWIALNISYDPNSLNSSNENNQTASEVWKSRIAVCEGFSNLFHNMCQLAGLESRIIKGYVKNFAGNDLRFPNHAWNSVKINGKWKLLDVTWASVNHEASAISNPSIKQKYLRHKLDYFFLVNPNRMILTHLPEDPYWQLQNNYVSMEIYRQGESYIKSTLMNPYGEIKNFEQLIATYESLDSLDKSISYLERMERNNWNKVKEYGLGIAYYYKAQKILKEAPKHNKYKAIQRAKIYYQKSLDQLAFLEKDDYGYEFSRDLTNNVVFRMEALQ